MDERLALGGGGSMLALMNYVMCKRVCQTMLARELEGQKYQRCRVDPHDSTH